ncbi:hypothetical protein [Streptomyces monashensis]|nr:hypothetical protein [Streptomyces monashensis]
MSMLSGIRYPVRVLVVGRGVLGGRARVVPALPEGRGGDLSR